MQEHANDPDTSFNSQQHANHEHDSEYDDASRAFASSQPNVLAVTTLAASALSAQVTKPVAPQEVPVVLRGATIHTVTKGTITNGTIVMDRGKITAIGGAGSCGAAWCKNRGLVGQNTFTRD